MATPDQLPSPFDYPSGPHQRRHGPRGHTSYRAYKPWLRDEFQFRCVYCLTREKWRDDGHNTFTVDHVKPKSRYKKLTCRYDNLVYACSRCNTLKSNNEDVPDPCKVSLGQYLKCHPSGVFHQREASKSGKKEDESVGKRLIAYLKLNEGDRVKGREQRMAEFELLRRQPQGSYYWFQYPLNLPDLSKLKPPKGNTRHNGIAQSHYSQQKDGKLPPHY